MNAVPPARGEHPSTGRRGLRGFAVAVVGLTGIAVSAAGATPGHQRFLPLASAQELPLREYALKAALLYNVAKYTDWPATAFAKPDDPIVLGVLGDDPFGEVLDSLAQGRIINGHPIVVRRASGASELKGAHLVFISSSEAETAQNCSMLERFRVLTVGDTVRTAPFTMINFAVEGDRIVFVVDLERASRIGVQISSKLLNFAKQVKKAERNASP